MSKKINPKSADMLYQSFFYSALLLLPLVHVKRMATLARRALPDLQVRHIITSKVDLSREILRETAATALPLPLVSTTNIITSSIIFLMMNSTSSIIFLSSGIPLPTHSFQGIASLIFLFHP